MKTGKCLKQKMCQKRSNEYDLSAAPYLFPFFYSTSGLAQALKSQSELSKMLEARASFGEMELLQNRWMSHEDRQVLETKDVSKEKQ